MNPPFVPHVPHPATCQAVKDLFVIMNKQKCTIAYLARRSGVASDSISRWKRGKRNISYANLEACYNVLGYTLAPRLALDTKSDICIYSAA